MYILFGILNSIIIIFLDYLLMAYVGISISSFGLLFIIPIGGLAEGALCSYLMFKTIKRRHVKVTKKHYIIAALLALVTFWGINYTDYASSYLKGDVLNNKFQGEHIRHYMYNATETFTFGNYLKYKFETQEVRLRRMSNSVSFGKGYNMFRFGITMLGFVLGSVGLGLSLMKGLVYCDKCSKYMQEKELYNFQLSHLEEETRLLLEVLKDTKEKVQAFLTNERPLPSYAESYIQVCLTYCPDCNDGLLVYKHLVPKKDSKGNLKWEEDEAATKKVQISYDMTEKLL